MSELGTPMGHVRQAWSPLDSNKSAQLAEIETIW